MIKSVVFDLDNTLLDRDASVIQFIDDQYDRLVHVLGHIRKDIYMTRFIELDSHGYVWKDKVYKQLTDEFNIKGVTWEKLLDDYINKFQLNCVPFPNLLPMLDKLSAKDLKLGIITNGFGQFQMNTIKALGIEKYFDVILISEWEGIKKPHANIFKRALEKLNVSSQASIYIGDHPINDVRAAQKVGMKGIWKRNNQFNIAEADGMIDDLMDVLLFIT